MDDCGDASVRIGLFGQVELREDRSYVCFECLLGAEQRSGDGAVGFALCHEVKDVAFAIGQPVESGARALPLEQSVGDDGVDDGRTGSDGAAGCDELVEVSRLPR